MIKGRKYLLSALLILIWVLAFVLFEFLTPLHSPQYVVLANPPLISSDDVLMDGREIEGAWKVIPYGPKKFAQGFDALVFDYTTPHLESLFMPPILSITIPMKVLTTINSGTKIEDILLSIQFNGEKYGEDTQYFTNSNIFEKCPELKLLEGTINIEKNEHKFKKFVLKGDLSLNSIMSSNVDDCLGNRATLEIKDLKFDIDSELIYEWSNKGGHTYRI